MTDDELLLDLDNKITQYTIDTILLRWWLNGDKITTWAELIKWVDSMLETEKKKVRVLQRLGAAPIDRNKLKMILEIQKKLSEPEPDWYES